MMSLSCGIRQTLEQKQKLVIKQELRHSLIQAVQLDFPTGHDEEDDRRVLHLKNLSALSDDSLKKKISGGVETGDEMAEVLDNYWKKFGNPRVIISRAISAPENGYCSLAFLANAISIGEWLTDASDRERFRNILEKEWDKDRVCQGSEAVSSLLKKLQNPDALFRLADIIREEENLQIFTDTAELEFLTEGKKISKEDVNLLSQLLRDAVVLMPHRHYWNPQRREEARKILSESPEVFQRYERISPLIVTAFLPVLDEELTSKLYLLAQDEYIQRSADNKRSLIGGVVAVRENSNLLNRAEDIIRHTVSVCDSAKGLVKIYRQLPFIHYTLASNFPFHIRNAEQLLNHMNGSGLSSILKELELTEQEESLVMESLDRLNRRGLLTALVGLYNVYKVKNYKRGKELVKIIVLRLAEKKFDNFRYTHEYAEKQLEILEYQSSWQENVSCVKHIGDISGIESATNAMHQAVPVLERKFKAIFPDPVWWETASLQELFNKCVDEIKSSKSGNEKQKAIAQKKEVEVAYRIKSIINELRRMTPDGFLILGQITRSGLAQSADYPSLFNVFYEINSLYSHPKTNPATFMLY